MTIKNYLRFTFQMQQFVLCFIWWPSLLRKLAVTKGHLLYCLKKNSMSSYFLFYLFAFMCMTVLPSCMYVCM